MSVIASPAQAPANNPELTVKAISGQTTRLGTQEFAKLTQIRVQAVGHDGKTHEYEGVNLRDVLAQAGAPTGDALHGKEMVDYVLAEASDGYRVLFSVAELDPEFGDRQVLVADKMDGKPLPPQDGPLRLVVLGDKRQARWVRMLQTLTAGRLP